MIVALSGTPGTGKSKIAKKLKRDGWTLVNIGRAVKNLKLYSSYDRARKCYIADMRKVNGHFKRLLKKMHGKNVVIDGHISHELLRGMVDIVIVLRCAPRELERRLRKRGWPLKKIVENLEAEYIGQVSYDARKKHEWVYNVDTSGKSASKSLKSIKNILNGRGKKYMKEVDWIARGKRPIGYMLM